MEVLSQEELWKGSGSGLRSHCLTTCALTPSKPWISLPPPHPRLCPPIRGMHWLILLGDIFLLLPNSPGLPWARMTHTLVTHPILFCPLPALALQWHWLSLGWQVQQPRSMAMFHLACPITRHRLSVPWRLGLPTYVMFANSQSLVGSRVLRYAYRRWGLYGFFSLWWLPQ